LTPTRRPTEVPLTITQVLREIERMKTEVGKRDTGRPRQAVPAAVRDAGGVRSPRAVVDYDEEAAAAAQARIDQAEVRNAPLAQPNLQRKDDQVRQVASHSKPSSRPTVRQLRDAFVWAEILGPPGGLP